MVDRLKNSVKGALVGALFGVLFATLASMLHGGPELKQGIMETWWWFAGLGAFGWFFSPKPRVQSRTITYKHEQSLTSTNSH